MTAISVNQSLVNKFRSAFRPRELHLHDAQGVKTLRIGSRTQMALAGVATAVIGWSVTATVGLLMGASSLSDTSAELAAKEQAVARMEAEVAQLKRVNESTVARIEGRQKFLAALVTGEGDLTKLAALATQEAPVAVSDRFAHVVSPLAELEGKQLAFVQQATTAALARQRDTEALLSRLGLAPSRFLRQTSVAMGGPYEPVANADPAFKQLFVSWTRVDQLERSMISVPAMKPVRNYSLTSGYGVRYDPFNGGVAMHAGIDMAGPVGEPIYASADGTVGRAGWTGGYGNMVELEHGKGIQTRYGHLSKIIAKPGQKVKRGELIALMGSTGRSTGSHLHYEVRIDGRAVNPLPFLQSADALAAVQSRAVDAMGGPAEGGPADAGPAVAD